MVTTLRGLCANIVLIEDDYLTRELVQTALGDVGHTVVGAATAAAGRELLAAASGSVVALLDLGLPDADGLSLLGEIRREHPDVPVIVMTGRTSVDTAVEAMRQGAYHYLTKPIDLGQLVSIIQNALEASTLRRELIAARTTSETVDLDGVIGDAPEMKRIKELVARFAQSPASTVLITGESGTGKDVLARALHARSDRARGPFTNVTCSAMPEPLLESELFGHEKGAFTGAHQQKKGLLELSERGTVFLDEIGEMSPMLQAKLLRVLESKTFRRVGGTKDLTPDVRIVAATNRDLREEVRAGRFREDLFYRLAVLHVHLPPLRERREDIPALVAHFVARFQREFRRPVRGVDPKTMARLAAQDWPGNVRELRNAVERAVLLAEENQTLGETDFELLAPKASRPPAVSSGGASVFVLPPEGLDLAALERSLVEQALARAGGNRTRAGRLLGLNRDQVRYRASKLDAPDDARGAERRDSGAPES